MVMRRFQDIELSENWRPVINRMADVLRIILPYLAAISIYFFSLSLGLCFASSLERVPIVNVLGYVFSFFAAVMGWLVALLFSLFGKEVEFSREVFLVIKQADFRMSVLFLFLSFFLARVTAGVLTRANISYSKTLKLFFVMLVILLAGIVLFFNFVNKTDEPANYYFVYSLLGIVYLLFARTHVKEKQGEPNLSRNRNMEQRENYSWDELKKIFRDLAD